MAIDPVPRSPYDPAAPSFDRHRALPAGVAEAIRAAVVQAAAASDAPVAPYAFPPRPRLLDLGAGTGRFGRAFVAAGDDYLAVDLSFGMLAEFAWRARREGGTAPRLVQADGLALPCPDRVFDAVMLMQVVGAARNWEGLITEARRVLRPSGVLVVGHTRFPPDGVDERMKERLASILCRLGIGSYHLNARADLQGRLDLLAASAARLIAASWVAERTPRSFIERQPTGARFSALPQAVKAEVLQRLSAWAAREFGSLDNSVPERHEFELRIFRF